MPHWLEVVLVVVHVLTATVWVGGTIALTFIAVPAIRMLAGEPRQVAMRTLGRRWRPIGWSALVLLVATGIPLASHVLPGSDAGAKAVFGVKIGIFVALLCFAYLHDFVLGPRLQRDLRTGAASAPATRSRLVVVGWFNFGLTIAVPVLGAVVLSTLD